MLSDGRYYSFRQYYFGSGIAINYTNTMVCKKVLNKQGNLNLQSSIYPRVYSNFIGSMKMFIQCEFLAYHINKIKCKYN